MVLVLSFSLTNCIYWSNEGEVSFNILRQYKDNQTSENLKHLKENQKRSEVQSFIQQYESESFYSKIIS